MLFDQNSQVFEFWNKVKLKSQKENLFKFITKNHSLREVRFILLFKKVIFKVA